MQLNISKQKQSSYMAVFLEMIFSRFTSLFSLRRKTAFPLAEGATHVAPCNNISTYFKFWCTAFPHVAHWKDSRKVAFTLAEVLITLGIIGVVAALTLPTLIENYKKSEISAKLKKFNTTMAQCVLLSEQDNGPAEEWSTPGGYGSFDLDNFFKTYLAPYMKYSNTVLNTEKLLCVLIRWWIFLFF